MNSTVESKDSAAGVSLRLNLGGRDTVVPGFKTVDLKPGPTVDYVTDISELSMFDDQTVDEIYASHCLEHFSHTKTLYVLEEWHRVLKKGAKCFISVPDFDAAIEAYKTYGMMCDYIRNILYGDQLYPLAYHYTCFTWATLLNLLHEAGFITVARLKWMPHGIKDCSKLIDTVTGKPVSLTVEATA